MSKDIKDFMMEFTNEKTKKLTRQEKKFEKYAKKFEKKFGRHAYIAEPGGTIESSIKAIKICLRKKKDILDELLYPTDFDDGRMF